MKRVVRNWRNQPAWRIYRGYALYAVVMEFCSLLGMNA